MPAAGLTMRKSKGPPPATTGVYISFPFCRQKCTYCNFSSGVFPEKLVGPYLEALRAEIDGTEYPSRPETLYLGGGTPSLMKAQELEAVLNRFPVTGWREATIEASPGTVTEDRAAAWARLGINRVSLGVQSFVPTEASAAGRKHTPEQVADEVKLLRRHGIRRINLDLIAGLAHQTERSWRTSLDWIERIEPEHVSVYMLEVDDDSRLGGELRAGGARYGAGAVPSERQITEFYLTAVERLGSLSLLRYEISNFARPGEESLHNLKYWTMQPYVGFGADAHSFDGQRRWGNVSSPAEYVERRGRGEEVRRFSEALDDRRWIEERFMTGLRRLNGLAMTPAEEEAFRQPLTDLRAKGWVSFDEDRQLRLTDQGVLFSNEVFGEFLLDRSP